MYACMDVHRSPTSLPTYLQVYEDEELDAFEAQRSMAVTPAVSRRPPPPPTAATTPVGGRKMMMMMLPTPIRQAIGARRQSYTHNTPAAAVVVVR